MVVLILHFLKAESGDCILLELNNKKCVLIDGGFAITYYDYLKPLLIDLYSQGCSIEYLVLTHFDQDHIIGLLNLMRENGKKGKEKIIPVKNIICNNFSFLFQSGNEGVASGNLPISYSQQKSFEELCFDNGYVLPEKVISGDSFCGSGYTIKIISPTFEDLKKCCKKIESSSDEIIKRPIDGKIYDDIGKWSDCPLKSPLNTYNCASLAFEIIYKDKRLLFCGDANMGAYKDKLDKKYDLIKLSHHGTFYGNQCFVGKNPTTAEYYLLSTNACREEHPNRRLLSGILTQAQEKKLILNYNIKRSQNYQYELLFCEEQQKKYNFEVKVCNRIVF